MDMVPVAACIQLRLQFLFIPHAHLLFTVLMSLCDVSERGGCYVISRWMQALYLIKILCPGIG